MPLTIVIPSQAGKITVVTGTGGLGYETALALARAGGEIVLAGRNPEKGAESVALVKGAHPDARIVFEPLDLANLSSIADFARRLAEAHPRLDLLVNNAGVMAPPARRTTADGFELQFGTNYLGHFALTAGLTPLLRAAPAPRVVTVSSGVAHLGAIRFDDPHWERGYSAGRAYAQSKLANLMFALELQRRADAAGWTLMSNAAHPGYATTDLIANGPGSSLPARMLAPIASQSPADGALPTLMAAASPSARGGVFYGPKGFLGLKGPPGVVRLPSRATDLQAAKRLWALSETLTAPFEIA